MLETNITEAANIFLWIACIGIGFAVGLVTTDILKSREKDNPEQQG